MDAESIAEGSSRKGRGAKRKKKQISENAGRGNIQNLISNMPIKKKEEKLEDDDILSDIINEIDHPTTSTVTASGGLKNKPKQRFSLIAEKKAANLYTKSFAKPKIIKPLYKDETSPVKVVPVDETTNRDIDMEEMEDSESLNQLDSTDCSDTKKSETETIQKKKLLFTISEKKAMESKVEEVSGV